jgi:hypothetical protein
MPINCQQRSICNAGEKILLRRIPLGAKRVRSLALRSRIPFARNSSLLEPPLCYTKCYGTCRLWAVLRFELVIGRN